MLFEELDKEDRDIFLSNQYKPVAELFGEEIPNWHYHDFFVDGPMREVMVNGNVHKIRVKGHSYIFRWMMPKKPAIYKEDEVYLEEALKSNIFRYTIGPEPFLISEEEIKKIAKGETEVDAEFIANISDAMTKAFSLHTWKIPFCHISYDVLDFTRAWLIYSGTELIMAKQLEEKLLLKQKEQKEKLLIEVKEKIKSYPDYLSIVRNLVREKISMEDAIQQAGSPDIIIKGI